MLDRHYILITTRNMLCLQPNMPNAPKTMHQKMVIHGASCPRPHPTCPRSNWPCMGRQASYLQQHLQSLRSHWYWPRPPCPPQTPCLGSSGYCCCHRLRPPAPWTRIPLRACCRRFHPHSGGRLGRLPCHMPRLCVTLQLSCYLQHKKREGVAFAFHNSSVQVQTEATQRWLPARKEKKRLCLKAVMGGREGGRRGRGGKHHLM